MNLKMRDIRGKDIDVEVQANGRFSAKYGDDIFFSDTFDGLRTELAVNAVLMRDVRMLISEAVRAAEAKLE